MLSFGKHTVEAFLSGYKPATKVITVSSDAPKPQTVSFQLDPELIRVGLNSLDMVRWLDGLKMVTGKLSVDGLSTGAPQHVGFSRDGLPLSVDHTISVFQEGRELLAFSFRAEPGDLVTITTAMKSKNSNAVVVSSLGSRARIYASATNWQAAFNDHALQPIPPKGLDGSNLTENSVLTLDDGKSLSRLIITPSNAPSLAMFLLATSEYRVASLVQRIRLVTNPGGATATLDGKDEKSCTTPCQLEAKPGRHTVVFTLSGYQIEHRQIDVGGNPLDVPAVVMRSEAGVLIATVAQLIQLATSPGGATATLDGDGHQSCTTPCQLQGMPGHHTVVLTLTGYQESRVTIDVGGNPLDVPVVVLHSQSGVLMLSSSPPGASILINGKAVSEVTPTRLTLAPGSYKVTVEKGGQSSVSTVDIRNGDTRLLKVTLNQ